MTGLRYRLPLLLVLFAGVVDGQAIDVDARSGALAGATTALTFDPARGSLTLSASQSFGLPELRFGRIQYVQPLPAVAMMLDGTTFGNDLYRRSSAALGFTRVFQAPGPRSFRVEAQARFVHVGLRRYGAGHAFGLSVGLLVSLTPELFVGFRAENVNEPSGEVGRSLGRTLASGVQYRPDDRARVVIDVSKNVLYPVTVRTGIELRVAAPLFLRAGFATQPARVAGGFGVAIGAASIDIAFQRHHELGWSQAGSLGITW